MQRIFGIELIEKRDYKNRRIYRYVDTSIPIMSAGFNETEKKILQEALSVMQRFSEHPQFNWVYEIIPMLESKLGDKSKDEPVIGFDINNDLKGLEFLNPVFAAIVNQRVLKLTYQDFKADEPYEVIIHPYYLKQYNNRWQLIGFHPDLENKYYRVSLDRIHQLEETDLKYRKSNIDWEYYFSDFIGLTRNNDFEKPIPIKLFFNKAQAPYVLTKPLHETQKNYPREDGLEVVITVIPNYELERLILTYGPDVTVLEPDWLRIRIQDLIKQSLENYE